jgi:hypothetical protein
VLSGYPAKNPARLARGSRAPKNPPPHGAATIQTPSPASKAAYSALVGVADLRYEKLNMQVIETSIHKASGASTDLFHTLIKQHLFLLEVCNDTTQSIR